MKTGRRTVRRYGRPPYRVVVLHGGPGVPGSVAPLARALGRTQGVLEPWQSQRTVNGLVEELRHQVDRHASAPVAVIGHSWGAWLGLLFAARYPEKVRRVVLVGSPPFRARDARAIRAARRARLSPEDWRAYLALERSLSAPRARADPASLRRLGQLAGIADSFEPLPGESSRGRWDPLAYRSVWKEAAELRKSGELRRRVRGVRSPILILHGTSDPHPAMGVTEPLRRMGLSTRVVLFERCGHEPWRERSARAPFLRVLRRELTLP